MIHIYGGGACALYPGFGGGEVNEVVHLRGYTPCKELLWYVVQTKRGSESRVEAILRNHRVEAFLPQYKDQWCRKGKQVSSIKPLFSTYLFARLDLDIHYHNVKWTRGVSKILGNGAPIPVSDQVVKTIRDRVGEDNLIRLEDELREGDLVEFTSGPFNGLMGIFQRKVSARRRVRVLLSLIGVGIPVQASQWQVKKVSGIS
ncbi:MAG: hypothetical protein EHM36_00215 [Deltaproteobacteria bacterium]|nr:MAG: hypothetical protein EHM36_00215 [Deltaproteobacteria bacterium]